MHSQVIRDKFQNKIGKIYINETSFPSIHIKLYENKLPIYNLEIIKKDHDYLLLFKSIVNIIDCIYLNISHSNFKFECISEMHIENSKNYATIIINENDYNKLCSLLIKNNIEYDHQAFNTIKVNMFEKNNIIKNKLDKLL